MNINITNYKSKMCIIVENIANFNLTDTLESGQYLNYKKLGDNDFETVAFGKYLRVYEKDSKIYFETTSEDFNNIWRDFFDLDRDYKHIFETLRTRDKILEQASDFCSGLRILKQDPFECLISFIISQNNNIPRIMKITNSLCENFGNKINIIDNKENVGMTALGHPNVNVRYTFPRAETIAALSLEELSVIRSGFRAKYILDAATKIASGEINLDLIYSMSLDEGAEYLKQINGVGDKVAACVLLFAYNKLDAFPIDVRIKKILAEYYPNGYDFGEYAGVANSYLFNFANNIANTKEL